MAAAKGLCIYIYGLEVLAINSWWRTLSCSFFFSLLHTFLWFFFFFNLFYSSLTTSKRQWGMLTLCERKNGFIRETKTCFERLKFDWFCLQTFPRLYLIIYIIYVQSSDEFYGIYLKFSSCLWYASHVIFDYFEIRFN